MATPIKLDDALKARIQQLAEQCQRSSHWLMREAISQYVEREESRESFKREAQASWNVSSQKLNLAQTGKVRQTRGLTTPMPRIQPCIN